MAVSLIAEVMAYATGSDLAPTERFVLVAIAEHANAKTRQAWQDSGWNLADVVGLSASGLRDVLQRLAKRGLEVRVPLGKDKSGRVVYAVHGRQTTYRLPAFPRRDGDGQASHGDGQASPGDGQPSPYGDGQASHGDGQASPGDGQPSPFSSVSRQSPNNSSAREPRHIVMQHTDAKPSEAEAVINRIVNEIKPRSLGGFINHLARSGDLQTWVGEARAAGIRSDLKTSNELRKRMKPCPDGEPGGDQLHPTSGEPWCLSCRKRFRAARLNARPAGERTADPPGPAAPVVDLRTRRPA